MKQIILPLIVTLVLIMQGRSESQMEQVSTATKLLSLTSSLQDKARGLILARQYDDRNVNDALVAMLDDPTPGGRVSHDEAIEMPWIEAMHLLARRFPEAEVMVNFDYRYNRQDRAVFLMWWAENREHIKYRDNTHVLEVDKETKKGTDESSETHAAPGLPHKQDDSISAQKPQPPEQNNAPKAKSTTSTPSEEPASSTPWSIIVVLIVAAMGLLWLLVKKRN